MTFLHPIRFIRRLCGPIGRLQLVPRVLISRKNVPNFLKFHGAIPSKLLCLRSGESK